MSCARSSARRLPWRRALGPTPKSSPASRWAGKGGPLGWVAGWVSSWDKQTSFPPMPRAFLVQAAGSSMPCKQPLPTLQSAAPSRPLGPRAAQTQRDKIRNRRCREEVKRQMRHEAEDIRFDHALATACHK